MSMRSTDHVSVIQRKLTDHITHYTRGVRIQALGLLLVFQIPWLICFLIQGRSFIKAWT